MKSLNKKKNLTVTITIILVILVLYTYKLSINYKNDKIIEKLVGKKSPLKDLTKRMNRIPKQISDVTKKVNNVTNFVGKAVISPMKDAFNSIQKSFVEIGYLVIDIFNEFKKIPKCIISYIVWCFVNIIEQLTDLLLLPIITLFYKKLIFRFFPGYYDKAYPKYTLKAITISFDVIFYIISYIAEFLGIKKIFYNDECFSFVGKIERRKDKIKNHFIDAGNSFSNFGKT